MIRSGRAARGLFWLVDPLDGTKEFLSRNGEFTVNIALIEDGGPVLGVVLAPALGTPVRRRAGRPLWSRTMRGAASLSARAAPAAGATLVSSRSHGDADALARFCEGRPDRGVDHRGLVAQVLPRGRRRGRSVPALRADDGVGHRRGRRGPARRRRPRHGSRGASAAVRQAGLREPPVRRFRARAGLLGRRGLGRAPGPGSSRPRPYPAGVGSDTPAAWCRCWSACSWWSSGASSCGSSWPAAA